MHFSVIYTIIICLPVAVSKMQVTILARSSREMSQTVRIDSTFSLRKDVHAILLPQNYLVLNFTSSKSLLQPNKINS